MSEQLLGTRPVFGLHKDAADKVPRLVRDVQGQQRVGGLGGDLEYGCHCLIFSPWRFFCQHLHHCTAKAPAKDTNGWLCFSLMYMLSHLTTQNKYYALKECFKCGLHSLPAEGLLHLPGRYRPSPSSSGWEPGTYQTLLRPVWLAVSQSRHLPGGSPPNQIA